MKWMWWRTKNVSLEQIEVNNELIEIPEPPPEYTALEPLAPSWKQMIETFQNEFDVRTLAHSVDQQTKLRAASILINIFKGAEKDKEIQKKLKVLPTETLVNMLGCLSVCISDLS